MLSPAFARLSCALVLSCGLVACCGKSKTGGSSGGEAVPTTTAAAATTTAPAAGTTAAPSAPAGLPSCSKTALLDMATPSRPPVPTPVLGVRLPAGGVPKAKKPLLSSIEYFTRDTPKIEVACTVREQLEKDKWVVESMTGTSPVTMVARKGKSAVQIMVGPGASDITSLAIVTPVK